MPSNLRRKPRAAAEARCAPSGRLRSRATGPFAPLFRALGDETRLQMVGVLAARGELCVCELEGHFDLGQPTVSHHLRILREAGVVTSERRGTWVYYALDPAAVARLRAFQLLLER